MGGSFGIGKIAGIKISVHWTFFILIALVLLPGQSEVWWNLALVLTVFFIIVLHELGHALTAKYYGIKTKDITLLPIGGLARLEKMPDKPVQELWVSLAGPAVNIGLALILLPFVQANLEGSIFNVNISVINQQNFLASLFSVNVSLAAFNLLPAFPMDGGRVLRAALSMRLNKVRATQIASTIGQAMAFVLALFGFFFSPILIFIALFVFISAQQEKIVTESNALLAGYSVSDVTMKQFTRVQANEPLSNVVAAMLDSQSRDFVVFDQGQVVGIIGQHEIAKALADNKSDRPVNEVMIKNFPVVDPSASLEEVYDRMQKNQTPFVLVAHDNNLKGVLDLENILEMILVNKAKSKANQI
jgi:Zn-dependent protease/predicted transcriptional regulator